MAMNGVNKPLAIFATFLVVGGIAAVAYISSLEHTAVGKPAQTAQPPVVKTPVQTSTVDWMTTSTLLLVSDQAATVMSLDGKSQRLTLDAFRKTFVTTSTLIRDGVEAGSGSPASFASVVSPTQDGRSFPSPDRAETATLLAPKSDGAGVIGITKDGGAVQSIVLRLKNGTPLRDAQIYGWSGPDQLYVAGVIKGARWVYLTDTSGNLTEQGMLPDTAMTVVYRDGRFWYITVTPGPGLESPPMPPSELFTLEPGLMDPPNRSWIKDQDHVITGFTFVGTGMMNGEIAYVRDDGQAFIRVPGGTTTPIGKIRPLLFLDEDHLLLRDGFTLSVRDIPAGTVRKIGDLPEGQVRIFYNPVYAQ